MCEEKRRRDDEVDSRLKALEDGQIRIAAALEHNSKMTNESVELTKNSIESIQELLMLFQGAKRGIRTAQWIGSAVKTLLVTAGVLLGAWMSFKKWMAGL